MNVLTNKADQLLEEATMLRERAETLRGEAIELYRKQGLVAHRKENDKLINRKQAIELLWFDSYPTLRDWEAKVNRFGYLQFIDDKILRSEVLRFLDDYQSGAVHRKMNKKRRCV